MLELIQKAPFKITSLPVDGGSEFMAEFEQACQDLNIELIILPHAKPTYNGVVECVQGLRMKNFIDRGEEMFEGEDIFSH